MVDDVRTAPLDVVAATALSGAAGAMAGAVSGFLWGGIGGRVAMRVLVLTSEPAVRGLTSDDGFPIGRISADTIVLLIGATLAGGILGGGYGLYRKLLVGPLWLVAIGWSLAVGAGIGGGVIVNAEGIDFRVLEPLWLAIALFVFLPLAWGATVVVLTDRLVGRLAAAASPVPGVDDRPLGPIGNALGWAGLVTVVILGVLDLVNDIEQIR